MAKPIEPARRVIAGRVRAKLPADLDAKLGRLLQARGNHVLAALLGTTPNSINRLAWGGSALPELVDRIADRLRAIDEAKETVKRAGPQDWQHLRARERDGERDGERTAS